MKICPVCGRKFKTAIDTSCGHLCEEWGFCKCGYSYEFLFGYTREDFGPFAVITGYNYTQWQLRWAGWLSRLYCGLWRFITLDGCI